MEKELWTQLYYPTALNDLQWIFKLTMFRSVMLQTQKNNSKKLQRMKASIITTQINCQNCTEVRIFAVV